MCSYPTDSQTHGIDEQFLWGYSILVSPVLYEVLMFLINFWCFILITTSSPWAVMVSWLWGEIVRGYFGECQGGAKCHGNRPGREFWRKCVSGNFHGGICLGDIPGFVGLNFLGQWGGCPGKCLGNCLEVKHKEEFPDLHAGLQVYLVNTQTDSVWPLTSQLNSLTSYTISSACIPINHVCINSVL